MNRQPSSVISVSIKKEATFAEVTFNGEIKRQALDDSFFQLIQHPNFKFNMNACYDFTLAFSGLEMAEIQEHAQFVAGKIPIRGQHYKLAFVSNETFNNALLSVYKLLISATSVEAEIFATKAQAISWLNKAN